MEPLPQPLPLDTTNTPKDQKSYLAAFLLTAFLGLVGTNRLYTGHVLIGWIRAVLLLISVCGPFLFVVNLSLGIIGLTVALTAGTVAMVWWYIDLWLYYLGAVKDKTSNTELVILGKKDKSYARSMMLSSHLLAILIPLLISLGVAYGISQLKGSINPLTNNKSSNQSNLLQGAGLDQLQNIGL